MIRTYSLPIDQEISTEQIREFTALCAQHGVCYVGVQPKMWPGSKVGPLWLINLPDCQDTTRCVAVLEQGQEAALLAVLEECREQWHGEAPAARVA
jgi:hypothetical protein